MAVVCRSIARSVAIRSRILRSENLASKCTAFSLPHAKRSTPCLSRMATVAFRHLESLMPLHSAIASARLKSIIGVSSTSWSCLSQGVAIPL